MLTEDKRNFSERNLNAVFLSFFWKLLFFCTFLLREPFFSPRLPIFISAKSGNRTYTPALTRESEFKYLWKSYYDTFISNYEEKFETKFGKIPIWKKAEAEKLLNCGKFNRGFIWNECHDCKIVLAVPFSCKSRLCLSCYRKKLFGWSIHLSRILSAELPHYHIVFTLPRRLNELLFQRLVNPRFLNCLAAKTYTKRLRATSKADKNFKLGILSTLHEAGNHLNFNPHIHAIATRDLVNTTSDEIKEIFFMPYKTMRFDWQRTVCKYLLRKKILSKEEYTFFMKSYPRGFHVYFEKINIAESDSIYRFAQYIAFGLFHNSQIQKVDTNKQTLTFRYKSNVESITKEKSYQSLTMPIDEFLARMLFFLPNKHTSMYSVRAKNQFAIMEFT
ncbi:putative transposase [Leptospira yanagawae serovar Saopaulo str. Sao Paulo = ATCC 700523]|uniref:Putative transposase n=1 Tax=Leptospira yanagawae serovar Saopaulo str. Sao Paulo = ATCC 700523 TaxID=1249483 RepID=A0A5E8HB44_9LEPT|nr:transposase [Leptospira yanagawae]EOQ87226.1 putative transposase [Leptospira yanagawae serovar Saopaulo str. Sao Paulo = ATCC 700523]